MICSCPMLFSKSKSIGAGASSVPGCSSVGGQPLGRCPAGGGHNGTMSANYGLDYTNSIAEDVPVEGMQDNWRYCGKCLGLFWGGGAPFGVCPVGGQHQVTFEVTSYLLNHTEFNDPGHDQWRWCSRCYSLFFSDSHPKPRPTPGGAQRRVVTTQPLATITHCARPKRIRCHRTDRRPVDCQTRVSGPGASAPGT